MFPDGRMTAGEERGTCAPSPIPIRSSVHHPHPTFTSTHPSIHPSSSTSTTPSSTSTIYHIIHHIGVPVGAGTFWDLSQAVIHRPSIRPASNIHPPSTCNIHPSNIHTRTSIHPPHPPSELPFVGDNFFVISWRCSYNVYVLQ